MGTGVLFDLDGTLVDTTYLHTVAWWRAFRRLGTQVPAARLHRLIGMGSDRLVPEIVGHDDPRFAEHHHELFRELRSEASVLPGARDLLRRCHDRGLLVVVATSAKPDDADHLVGLLDADDSIDFVTTSKDVGESKPAPDIFATAIDACGLDPADAVAVGDTRWDIEASAKLDIDCVALQTGGWAECALLGAGAVGVYRDPAALLDAFDESPLGHLARRAMAGDDSADGRNAKDGRSPSDRPGT